MDFFCILGVSGSGWLPAAIETAGHSDSFDSKREWAEMHVGGTENREPSETDERIK